MRVEGYSERGICLVRIKDTLLWAYLEDLTVLQNFPIDSPFDWLVVWVCNLDILSEWNRLGALGDNLCLEVDDSWLEIEPWLDTHSTNSSLESSKYFSCTSELKWQDKVLRLINTSWCVLEFQLEWSSS